MDSEEIYPIIYNHLLKDKVDKQENVMKMWLLGQYPKVLIV